MGIFATPKFPIGVVSHIPEEQGAIFHGWIQRKTAEIIKYDWIQIKDTLSY